MWFIGEHPCNKDGTEIVQIKHSSGHLPLADGIVVQHGFSSKPPNAGKYADYHAKVKRYVEMIEAPAASLKPGVTARTFKPVIDAADTSVFKYSDTASSRAGISAISQKLAVPSVAIVGLGGTGSYVLDFVAKTHVREIHLFDGDVFSQHNAFRSPGAPGLDELTNPFKVNYFTKIYQRMRYGIVPHAIHITEENVDQLKAYTFVFVCIDRPVVRKIIATALLAAGVPFIDVGMDIQLFRQESLRGLCRTTLSTPTQNDHLVERIPFAETQIADIYAANIQVAELNALNAAFAAIRWKKFLTFYLDQMHEHNSVYSIDTNGLSKDVRP